jgi:hypothetical protein
MSHELVGQVMHAEPQHMQPCRVLGVHAAIALHRDRCVTWSRTHAAMLISLHQSAAACCPSCVRQPTCAARIDEPCAISLLEQWHVAVATHHDVRPLLLQQRCLLPGHLAWLANDVGHKELPAMQEQQLRSGHRLPSVSTLQQCMRCAAGAAAMRAMVASL